MASVWLDFTKAFLDFLGKLAWPVALVLLVRTFRHQLAGLLPRVRSAKFPGGEVQLDAAQELVDELQASANDDETSERLDELRAELLRLGSQLQRDRSLAASALRTLETTVNALRAEGIRLDELSRIIETNEVGDSEVRAMVLGALQSTTQNVTLTAGLAGSLHNTFTERLGASSPRTTNDTG